MLGFLEAVRSPTTAEARAELAQILFELGEREEAVAQARQARGGAELEGTSEAWLDELDRIAKR